MFMKSILVLLLAGSVTMVCGQYFGWWQAPIPGLERVPSYETRRDSREQVRAERRQLNGIEDKDGKKITNEDTKRREASLKAGQKKVGSKK